MSRQLGGHEYSDTEYDLGDWVYFDHRGDRLYGQVVRVYNTREVYHVEVDEVRYEVHRDHDNMRRTH